MDPKGPSACSYVGERYDESCLPAGWKFVPAHSQSLKPTFISPDNQTFTSKRDVMRFLRKDMQGKAEENDEMDQNGGLIDTEKMVTISNQVMVRRRVRDLWRRALLDRPDLEYRREPTVLVPKLQHLIKDLDCDSWLESVDECLKVRVNINLIHSDESQENNIPRILYQLQANQANFDKDHGDDEDDVDESEENDHADIVRGRPIRAKSKHNYKEPSLDDDLPLNRYAVKVPEKMGDDSTDLGPDPTSADMMRERGRFSEAEIAALERSFFKNPYPRRDETDDIARRLGVSGKRVRIWYQNKRNKTDDGKMRCFFARNKLSDSDDDEIEDEAKIEPGIRTESSSLEGSQVDRQECAVCNIRFSTRMKFRMHQRRAHPAEPGKPVYSHWNGLANHDSEAVKLVNRSRPEPAIMMRNHPEPGNSSRQEQQEVTAANMKCPDCGELFDTRWNMRTHAIEMHDRFTGNYVGDEMNDDDEQSANNGRAKLTKSQIVALRKIFANNPYPSKADYKGMEESLSLSSKTLHSWFQNNRHREKVRVGPHPAGLMKVVRDSQPQTSSSTYAAAYEMFLDQDSSSGMGFQSRSSSTWEFRGRSAELTEHQKYYLQSFFSQKQEIDEEDVRDLSTELLLSPVFIRDWFANARKSMKYQPPNGGIVDNKSSRRFAEFLKDESNNMAKMKSTSERSSFSYSQDSTVSNGKQQISRIKNPLHGIALTEFQRQFLEDFYKTVKEPDTEFLNYLCDRVNATRETIVAWFQEKNRKNPQPADQSDDVTAFCRSLLTEVLDRVDRSQGNGVANGHASPVHEMEFSCPYCGKSFHEESQLKEHERLEAIEFEKEAQKFGENGDKDMPADNLGEFVTIDDMGMENHGSFSHQLDQSTMNDYGSQMAGESLNYQSDDDGYDDDNYLYETEEYLNDLKLKRSPGDKTKRPPNPFTIWLQEESKRSHLKHILTSGWESSREKVLELTAVWRRLSIEEKFPYIEEARRLREVFFKENPNSREVFDEDTQSSMAKVVAYTGQISRPTKKSLVPKDYLCKRCNVGFSTKGNLFKHLRNFHPENPYDASLYEMPKNGVEKVPKVRNCEICGMEFVSKVGMSKHMERCHPHAVISNDNNDSMFSPFGGRKRRADFSDNDEDSIGFADPMVRRRFEPPPDITTDAMQAPSSSFADTLLSSTSSDMMFSAAVETEADEDDSRQDAKAHVKTKFTEYQRQVLVENFNRSFTMSKLDAKQLYISLAEELQLPTKIVRIWFQNARSARKRGKIDFSR